MTGLREFIETPRPTEERRRRSGRIAQAIAFANSKAWPQVAQIVLIDPFTAGVGVGGATENGGCP